MGDKMKLTPLSRRTTAMLERIGVETVADLRGKSAVDLLRMPAFGKKSLQEVREFLDSMGYTLAGEEKPLGRVVVWINGDAHELNAERPCITVTAGDVVKIGLRLPTE